MAGTTANSSQGDPRKRAGTYLVIEGIVLFILGAIAIFLPLIAGLAVTIFLGWLFLIGGIVGLISTFGARHLPGNLWSLVSALLAIAAGVLLVGWPAKGLISVTLVLIAFFVADGLVSLLYALAHRSDLGRRWGWMLASGIVTLAIAIIVALGLPGSAAWALGLLVGIDMVMGGSSLIAFGLGVRAQP